MCVCKFVGVHSPGKKFDSKFGALDSGLYTTLRAGRGKGVGAPTLPPPQPPPPHSCKIHRSTCAPVPTHPSTYPPTHPPSHTHTLVHTCKNTHTCKHTHMHMQTHAHSHTHLRWSPAASALKRLRSTRNSALMWYGLPCGRVRMCVCVSVCVCVCVCVGGCERAAGGCVCVCKCACCPLCKCAHKCTCISNVLACCIYRRQRSVPCRQCYATGARVSVCATNIRMAHTLHHHAPAGAGPRSRPSRSGTRPSPCCCYRRACTRTEHPVCVRACVCMCVCACMCCCCGRACTRTGALRV